MPEVRQPEIVVWDGEIFDEVRDHSAASDHRLKFSRKETGEIFKIFGSPELQSLYHQKEKNLAVQLRAERRFAQSSEWLRVLSFALPEGEQ